MPLLYLWLFLQKYYKRRLKTIKSSYSLSRNNSHTRSSQVVFKKGCSEISKGSSLCRDKFCMSIKTFKSNKKNRRPSCTDELLFFFIKHQPHIERFISQPLFRHYRVIDPLILDYTCYIFYFNNCLLKMMSFPEKWKIYIPLDRSGDTGIE